MDSVNYDTLLQLLPEPARAYVLLFLQLVAAFSVAVPVIEKIVKATSTKRDDRALEVVQRVLSVFPRVNVPALSKRPPAPAAPAAPAPTPVQWPSADKVAAVLEQPAQPPEQPKI